MTEHIYVDSDREHERYHVIPFGSMREEIVRCRDCKYGLEVEWPKYWNIPADYLDCVGELVETWDYWNDQPKSNPVKPDGYCAWGERK